MSIHLEQWKWSRKDRNALYESVKQLLKMEHSQLYFPIMSLYFYIHNTKDSHKCIDFKRNYYVKKITEILKAQEINSNLLIRGEIYDYSQKNTSIREIFCKSIPLLDPIHFILNNYSVYYKRNPFLPSNYLANTQNKINNFDNMAYIDVFCSYLFSELTVKNKLPCFPIYYGSVNGLKNINYDITDDIDGFDMHEDFQKTLDKSFTLKKIMIDDKNSESSCSSKKTNSSIESIARSDISDSVLSQSYDSSSISSFDYPDIIVAELKECPTICLFIEKLEGTLDELINDSLCLDEIKSCYFQVAFSLAYLQKFYGFTHNDLHISNIMYSETERKYIYYKFNNIYFKIPTYGKIFKIIDFGRSIINFKNKIFMNDAFSKYGEAEGQYKYSSSIPFMKSFPGNEPSYFFDLCRLSITILDEVRENYEDEIDEKYDEDIVNKYDELMEFLKYTTTDMNNNRLDKQEDDFSLYINISKYAKNSLPKDILTNDFFREYRVKKSSFPLKTCYSLSLDNTTENETAKDENKIGKDQKKNRKRLRI